LIAGCVFGADGTTQDSDLIAAIVQILNLIFILITFLMTPAIILAGWLLSPDWTMGDFFGLRPYFIQVWVLVSNLVYIAFAFLLLAMAVIQIFGSNSNYAFKKKLPRFLVGILIVPFTWLIVSWTLSFANQAVAAVLSIPLGAIDTTKPGATSDSPFHLKTIPTKFNLDFSEDAPWSIKCGDNGATEDGVKCISPAEFIKNNDAGPFFIIMIYAYDIFKIQETDITTFDDVCSGDNGNAKWCIKELAKLLQKFWVALITTVFFGIILIALCWVLLARSFKLWLYIMFSPLFGLAYAVGDEWLWKVHESSGGGWGGEWVSLGKMWLMPFFSLAMVPVFVSAVLSFGLLFVGVVNNTFSWNLSAETTWPNLGGFCTNWEYLVRYCIGANSWPATATWEGPGHSSTLYIGNNPDSQIVFNFWQISSGMVAEAAGWGGLGGAGQGLAEWGRDVFAHIILTLMSLGILWMGIKAAVSSDEVTKMAFEPFAKFGDSVGHFVQQVPSYIPTPHPAFKAFDPSVWGTAGETLRQIWDQHTYDKKKTLQDIMMNPGVREWIGDLRSAADDMKRTAQVLQENNTLWSSVWAFDQINKNLEKGLKKMENDTTVATSTDGQNRTLTIKSFIEKLESARDVSQRNSVIAEYKPLIEKMALSSDENVKNMAQVLLTNTSARSWTTVWKAFAGITLDSRKRTIKGLEKNPGSEVWLTQIKPEDLTPIQQQALQNPAIKDNLVSTKTLVEKKAALNQLFDWIPEEENEENNKFIQELAQKMYDLSQTQWTPSAPATPTAPNP
jgi:hypothetical protein